MNLEQVSFMAEIVAAIAVVLSLLYLGIQLRNSRLQSVNEFNYIVSKERADFLKILALDSELSRIIPLGLVGNLDGKENDYFRFTSYLYHLFVHIELGYRKGKAKEIDQELWNGWNEASEWWIRCPGVQQWWQHNLAGGFTKEFKTHVNKTIERVNKEDPVIFNRQLEFLEKAGLKKT
jgi:hypothetical protein